MPSGAGSNTFSEKLSAAEISRLEEIIRGGGFELRTIPYAAFSGKGEGVVCTVYTSGKCVIQGKGTQQFLENHLPEHADQDDMDEAAYEFDHLVLGSDESGKGDYFGPLVCAAVAFGPEHLPLLEELRFTDSKAMTAKAIRAAAPIIKANLAHEIVVIGPRKYNELYGKFRNLNHMLAWAHAKALSVLLERQPAATVVVDKFCDERVLVRQFPDALREPRLVLRPRAESNPAVAAASVLASDAFSGALFRLGKEFDLTLPKGAGSPVDAAARRLVKVKGPQVLGQVAKLHFATTDKVLGS